MNLKRKRYYFDHNLIKDLLGHILGNLEEAVSTSALGVDDSLWDSLSGEVSHLVEKSEVLSEDWATWTGSQGVLVVLNWSTRRGSDNLLFHVSLKFN